ncbi:unnamed protein product [Musa acuminata subsp. malaccensis]|uniref:(wild Malaysian banana) hypothetical protein n=1 Tax=Musa acuminata subsp. malaccensis TaxID=214687 RepID=A0A804I3S3_MUSAM|nr:unnamed protein product [Musa acuminata subsp. malaccensis]
MRYFNVIILGQAQSRYEVGACRKKTPLMSFILTDLTISSSVTSCW